VEDLIEGLGRIGIKLCPDTGHARCEGEDGYKPPSWVDVWPGQFASGSVYEMHVSADRQDMKGRDPDFAELSAREFQEFISSDWIKALNTDLGEMVVSAVENYVPPPDYISQERIQAFGGPALRMVVEIPPLPQLSIIRKRVPQHARFIENLANVVQHAGATPLLWDTKLPAR
jgi:hypothetical protein